MTVYLQTIYLKKVLVTYAPFQESYLNKLFITVSDPLTCEQYLTSKRYHKSACSTFFNNAKMSKWASLSEK